LFFLINFFCFLFFVFRFFNFNIVLLLLLVLIVLEFKTYINLYTRFNRKTTTKTFFKRSIIDPLDELLMSRKCLSIIRTVESLWEALQRVLDNLFLFRFLRLGRFLFCINMLFLYYILTSLYFLNQVPRVLTSLLYLVDRLLFFVYCFIKTGFIKIKEYSDNLLRRRSSFYLLITYILYFFKTLIWHKPKILIFRIIVHIYVVHSPAGGFNLKFLMNIVITMFMTLFSNCKFLISTLVKIIVKIKAFVNASLSLILWLWSTFKRPFQSAYLRFYKLRTIIRYLIKKYLILICLLYYSNPIEIIGLFPKKLPTTVLIHSLDCYRVWRMKIYRLTLFNDFRLTIFVHWLVHTDKMLKLRLSHYWLGTHENNNSSIIILISYRNFLLSSIIDIIYGYIFKILYFTFYIILNVFYLIVYFTKFIYGLLMSFILLSYFQEIDKIIKHCTSLSNFFCLTVGCHYAEFLYSLSLIPLHIQSLFLFVGTIFNFTCSKIISLLLRLILLRHFFLENFFFILTNIENFSLATNSCVLLREYLLFYLEYGNLSEVETR